MTIERMDYTGGPEPLQIRAAYVNAGLLETLGVAPMLGRLISPDEDVKGGPHNMVITHHFWREFLGADPNVLGRSLALNGNRYTVIGVMPATFALPEDETDIFVSLWARLSRSCAVPRRALHAHVLAPQSGRHARTSTSGPDRHREQSLPSISRYRR